MDSPEKPFENQSTVGSDDELMDVLNSKIVFFQNQEK
jgi:hypothetical protein